MRTLITNVVGGYIFAKVFRSVAIYAAFTLLLALFIFGQGNTHTLDDFWTALLLAIFLPALAILGIARLLVGIVAKMNSD